MLDVATKALEMAMRNGVTYADVRLIETHDRSLSTKNGRPGTISGSESIGAGIRLIANGCWGFAATDDLTPSGLEAAASLAIAIARASGLAKKQDVVLAPEDKYIATWVSPCRIDPFSISVDEQIGYLLQVDGELRRNTGVTLSETSLQFERCRQVFVSSLGSRIDQTRTTSGAGMAAHSFKDDEIQKRSYPNSFGGQYQLRGYELVHDLKMLETAPRIADEAAALHSADQCPEGRLISFSIAANLDSRFMSRSAIPLSSTGSWVPRRTMPA